MQCPGSVRISRDLPNIESSYALEGTAAHDLAARALNKCLSPDTWLDTEIHGIAVTEDMVAAVEAYVAEVMTAFANAGAGAMLLIEHQFDLAPVNPPLQMFGTADAALFAPARRRLTIFDYKHGAGVAKDAEGNPQPLYYALGALLEFEKTHAKLAQQIDEIEVVIVQPRAPHLDGIVRRHVLSYEDLLAWTGELLERARAVLDPQAPLVPGEWCRFCRAAGVCPALQQQAQELAQIEFADLPVSVPPDPALLPVDALAHILDHADILEDWLRAVRATVQAKLEHGEAVPGYKIVAKRAMRQWVGGESAIIAWMNEHDVGADDYYAVKLKSVKQAEIALERLGMKLPEFLYDKVSSGYTVAPEGDGRPGVALDPVHEFSALPPGRELP
jgi:hypothetical protein